RRRPTARTAPRSRRRPRSAPRYSFEIWKSCADGLVANPNDAALRRKRAEHLHLIMASRYAIPDAEAAAKADPKDPLVREAVELQAREESRHAAVLRGLVESYRIEVVPTPPEPLVARERDRHRERVEAPEEVLRDVDEVERRARRFRLGFHASPS